MCGNSDSRLSVLLASDVANRQMKLGHVEKGRCWCESCPRSSPTRQFPPRGRDVLGLPRVPFTVTKGCLSQVRMFQRAPPPKRTALPALPVRPAQPALPATAAAAAVDSTALQLAPPLPPTPQAPLPASSSSDSDEQQGQDSKSSSTSSTSRSRVSNFSRIRLGQSSECLFQMMTRPRLQRLCHLRRLALRWSNHRHRFRTRPNQHRRRGSPRRLRGDHLQPTPVCQTLQQTAKRINSRASIRLDAPTPAGTRPVKLQIQTQSELTARVGADAQSPLSLTSPVIAESKAAARRRRSCRARNRAAAATAAGCRQWRRPPSGAPRKPTRRQTEPLHALQASLEGTGAESRANATRPLPGAAAVEAGKQHIFLIESLRRVYSQPDIEKAKKHAESFLPRSVRQIVPAFHALQSFIRWAAASRSTRTSSTGGRPFLCSP